MVIIIITMIITIIITILFIPKDSITIEKTITKIEKEYVFTWYNNKYNIWETITIIDRWWKSISRLMIIWIVLRDYTFPYLNYPSDIDYLLDDNSIVSEHSIDDWIEYLKELLPPKTI